MLLDLVNGFIMVVFFFGRWMLVNDFRVLFLSD
jgi:hypothetical protein